MARKYHNLDGLLRDGLACFAAEGDSEAWERLVALARFIADVLDVLDSSVDDDPEGEGSDAPLDVRDVGDGSPLGGADAGHGPVRSDDLGLAPGLGDPMERVRALSRGALEAQLAGQLPGRAEAVAGASLRRRAVGGGGARS